MDRPSLKDVLPYTPENYLGEYEIEIIRNSFQGERGVQLTRILRKIFLPTISDPDMPIEEMGNDVLMAGVDFTTMPAEHVKPIVMGRQEAIKFIMGGFVKLKVIAHVPDEPEQNRAARRAADSSK